VGIRSAGSKFASTLEIETLEIERRVKMASATKHPTDRDLQVEERVRSFQIEVYRRVWNSEPPSDLMNIFEPGVALNYLGYRTQSVPRIGEQWIGGIRNEVAGIIDPEAKLVTISERFSPPSKRFTTAHELAHAVLHPDCPPMHRDFPLERNGVVRDRREVEANRFASAFLMPRKLVEERFYARFDCTRFELTDATAFALCGTKAETVLKLWRSARNLSLDLAGATSFNGQHFDSLAGVFKVAPLAMAIRLEELQLTRAR
jgi:hypothetical protein